MTKTLLISAKKNIFECNSLRMGTTGLHQQSGQKKKTLVFQIFSRAFSAILEKSYEIWNSVLTLVA